MSEPMDMNKVAAYINKEDGLVCAKCFKPFADTNKPVAWMHNFLCDFSPKQSEHFNIPLYTHPVKELTDEEIEEVFWDIANQKIDTPVLSFAKAILRKAQEK